MPEPMLSEPEVLAPVSVMCDEPGCGDPATYAYLWAWGAGGHVCAKHALILKQRSVNLAREVTLTSLTQMLPSPLSRDDRVRLHAEALSANEERDEVKRRALELYNANVELRREINRALADCAELRDQLADARAEADQLTAEKMSALGDLAERTAELVRLQNLLQAADTRPD